MQPPVVHPGTGNNIIINPCQRLNPILDAIRNMGKQFGDIVPDFQVGRTTGVLYLSLKYHRLHPEYIHKRIEQLGNSFSLRILLLMCDVSEHQEPIRELTKVCIIHNLTIMVAWTPDEAGHYLSTYKQFEHRPPDMIKERVENDHAAILRTALTSINKVNKTDVETLRTSLGSFADIAQAAPDQLSALPGFGNVKVRRIKDAFERPFRHQATSVLPERDRTLGALRATTRAKTQGSELGKSKPIARNVSPTWDLELDLTEDDTEAQHLGPSPINNTREYTSATAYPEAVNEGSPVWDIELDLNEDDDSVIGI